MGRAGMICVPAVEAVTSVPPGLLDDPAMASACSAAVDELEIAARLETVGVSNQVASDTYGRADVFDLAGDIFVNLPFEPAAAPPDRGPAPGGLRNLGRGALFIVPTLLFVAVHSSIVHHVTWWSLAVGVTAGWSLSQLVPGIGWPLRGRQDHASDSLVAVLPLVMGAAVAGVLGFLFLAALGGTASDVLSACVICTYMVAGAGLLLSGGEMTLALALAPAVALIGCHYLISPALVSARLTGWSAVVTVAMVVVLAGRPAFARQWRWPRLETAEWKRAGLYGLNGLSCGVLISALIAFGNLWQTSDRYRAVAIWPLLLSLGLMEWELSSYRHDSFTALRSGRDLGEFGRRSRRAFLYRFGLFAGALLLLCVAAESVAAIHHSHPILLIAVEGVFGSAFFLGLVVEAAGRVGQALLAWIAALLTLGAVFTLGTIAAGGVSAHVGIAACLAGGLAGSLCLAVLAWRIVASPFSY
jgi:hypothetical protein